MCGNGLGHVAASTGIKFLQLFNQPGTKLGFKAMEPGLENKLVKEHTGREGNGNVVRGCESRLVKLLL